MEAAVTVLLIFVVGMSGVTSAVLGFIAETKKLTPDDIHVSGRECVYPANPAHALAVCAIILLAVSQIVASVAGGCCRPGGGASKSTRRVVGVVVSILSWIMAVIAAVFYWRGAKLNAPGTRDATFAGAFYEKCLVIRGGVFVRAAVLSLVATSLAIKSCVLLRAPAAKDAPAVEGAAADEPRPHGQHPPEAGVAVGLPQWPAQGNGQAPYPQPAAAEGYGQARV
ncbi:hypothetical protein GQ55_3G257900 [Panicum hallii var. hallii]|uniref:Uncharacterized protein n=1 Tax=Panicum hallii var. hallii TaxID=1504633 RepID=A0A2T7EDD8_9POAL|nr:hypothetical protein GQ55_3G257900 [Panicum hallii var. hallii]